MLPRHHPSRRSLPAAVLLFALVASLPAAARLATPADDEAAGPGQTPAAASTDEKKDRHDADEDPADGRDADWDTGLQRRTHTLVLDGVAREYTSVAGRFKLEAESGKDRAELFFVAYTLDGAGEPASRPITFCFNGGPGSSSVWLHMGAFGPRRVTLPGDTAPAPPPYPLVDNPYSLIDLTDLVFIDPVTTGYSRAAQGVDDREFHGVSEDIAAVADFIRLYTTRFERWNSPKFLAGESYGTTRAAGLAGELQGRHGMYLNGLLLISSILDFGTARFDPGNDLPYPLFLPTYAATAWYHGRLAPELQADLGATLEEVEAFALGDYLLALAQGSALPEAQRQDIASRLSRYTGLSVDYVLRSNLRPVIHEVTKELTRDTGYTVGRLDSRFRGRDRDGVGSTTDFDPSYAAIQGAYTAVLNHYVRHELGYSNDLPYEILTGRVHPWNYGDDDGYVNTAETLRSAMSQNPHLRVFVANGYYDLATPYFATEYTFSHMALPEEQQHHVSMAFYEAGHMMYIHEPSAAKLKADLGAFYADTLQR